MSVLMALVATGAVLVSRILRLSLPRLCTFVARSFTKALNLLKAAKDRLPYGVDPLTQMLTGAAPNAALRLMVSSSEMAILYFASHIGTRSSFWMKAEASDNAP